MGNVLHTINEDRLDRLLTVDELCELLKLPKSTIYRWTSEKYIPHVKIGGQLRFRESSIAKWLAENERGITGGDSEGGKQEKREMVCRLVLPNGKRFRKIVGSKKQAEEVEKTMQKEIIEGKWEIREKQKITFDDLVIKYLEYAKVNKAKSTYSVDYYRIKAHLSPYFNDINVKTITRQMVDDYKSMRSKDKASPKTINNELVNLSHILKMAVRWDYLDSNVVANVDKMKMVRNTPRFLSESEIGRLIDASNGSYIHALVVTALHTGMRKSELFNLTWNDIDFEQGTITIQSKDDWHTKNYKPRVLAMTDVLQSTLVAHRRLNLELGYKCDYVFTYDGQRIMSSVAKSLKRICDKAGLADVTLHTLRHTFASQLVMADVPLRDVQELMGHADYKTTEIYAHLSEGHTKKQVQKLPYGKQAVELRIVGDKAKTA